jgi:mono/diheme cytochrome c family protein
MNLIHKMLLTSIFLPVLAFADGLGQQHYILNCAGCHGFDGSGSETNGIPDLRHSIGHYLRIKEGREYLIQVPGVANSPLTDKETVQVVAWMLKAFSANEMPLDAKPYSKEEVQQYRATVPADIPAMRERVIKTLRKLGYSL